MLEKFYGCKPNAGLEVVSGDEMYVYCFDPETKQQSQQWIPIAQSPPQKVIQSHIIAKQMIALFVSHAGHVATIPLVTQRTVTSALCVRECLPLVLAAVAKRCPRTRRCGLLLHHDNAAAHRAVADGGISMTKFNEPESVVQRSKNTDFCLKFTLLFGIQLNLAYFDNIEIYRIELNSKQKSELHCRCSFLVGIQFKVM